VHEKREKRRARKFIEKNCEQQTLHYTIYCVQQFLFSLLKQIFVRKQTKQKTNKNQQKLWGLPETGL